MHPTGGSLRVFKQFVWLEAGSAKMAWSRPTHQRVTPAVGQWIYSTGVFWLRDDMHLNSWKNALVVLIVIVLGVACGTNPPAPTPTSRVSVASDGTRGNDYSDGPSISADGRYVAFNSYATNLVRGDTNGGLDVFIRDIQTGTTTFVSVASDGTQGDDYSGGPSISADGRYVAFDSHADNLVSGDTNQTNDVFVRDMQTGATMLVSVTSDGTHGNDWSGSASISADGSYVAFDSDASNLVSSDTNSEGDIFVYDMQTGTMTLVSVASDGTQGNSGSAHPSISADGRYVAFDSDASNLVSDDTNSALDVFVRDMQSGITMRVSVVSDGMQGDTRSNAASISADGHYVAFQSGIIKWVNVDTLFPSEVWEPDIFVRDMQSGVTTLVSVASDGTRGNGISGLPSITADGRYVAFGSKADNLVSGDANRADDIFVYDMQTRTTMLVSVAWDETQGNENSRAPSISADGRYVAFHSFASNLVRGDTNGEADIFLRVLGASIPILGG